MKTVAVIGLGYVGLPLACLLAKKGLKTYGIDKNKNKINLINKGISPIKDKKLERDLKKYKIFATSDFKALKKSDVIIICVPTPVDSNHQPNLNPLISATKSVAKELKKGHLVIVESTIFPGTIEDIVKPLLENNGMKAGKDFYLAHCPERIDPGNKKWDVSNIPRVIGAISKKGLKKASRFYRSFLNANVFELSTVKAAEAVKITENTFRDVNIAFVNELARSFDKLGIDALEVINAAATKPFAFMPHFPSCGVGGHCFDKNTVVFIKNSGHHKVKKIGSYIDSLECKKELVNDCEIFYPQNLQVLSFDMAKNETSFKPVKIASKRKSDDLLKITCPYNYSLKVTGMHPVIIYDNGLKIKWAKDVEIGDKLVLNKNLPSDKKEITISMIEHLPEELAKKIRVKPKNAIFSSFKQIIDGNVKGPRRDYYRNNSLPLKKYLAVEKLLKIKREELLLCTGRGPSFKKFPAVINLCGDFFRLVGYYLSEGCITEDKSFRTRFTFNKNEKEYIGDLKGILDEYNLDYSVYTSKVFDSCTVKVSSALFGFLLKDILKCGTNCYNMQVPEQFFELGTNSKEELLKGLFRGDGGVYFKPGKRSYMKNGRRFEHSNNTVEISYFTSSEVLFQQIMLLLLNQGIMPKLAKRKGYLSILNVSKAKEWFLGEKKQKILGYLKNSLKKIDYKKAVEYKNFFTLEIDSVEKLQSEYVYSMEVADTNTLVTSNGVIAHNCIPVDPYYLIEKAKQNGFNHTFLTLAREINNSMPEYTVQLLVDELNNIEKSIKNANVGILGLAYKKDVDDIRESPAFDIIKKLKEKKANLFIFDPFAKRENNVSGLDELLKKSDYLILVTDHSLFRNMDLIKLKHNGIKVIIDGKNCLDKNKIMKMGIRYKGIGR